MRKALLSTHKGTVQEILKPYHVSIQAAQRSELNEDEIMHRISDSSGTAVHVTEKKGAATVRAFVTFVILGEGIRLVVLTNIEDHELG